MGREVNLQRGASRREAIIEAAIELWSETGWRGTGITAVAERAGITHSGLLHHFGTKENLLLEVLAEQDRRTVDHFSAAFARGGLDTLRALPDIVRDMNEHPGMGKLHRVVQAENLDPGGPAHEYYATRQGLIIDAFADAIRTGQERGEIRPDAHPESVAAQILGFLYGAGMLAPLDDSAQIDMVALCKDFTALLLRDLASDTVSAHFRGDSRAPAE